MAEFLDQVRARVEPEGLNHIGVVSAARYDAAVPAVFSVEKMHPGTDSIVVLGSGGRLHWDRFLSYIKKDPVARLARNPHPLDSFCAALLEGLEGCRVVYPTQAIGFDFMRLAELAGLGAPSELGILVSERFGPWFALRAAIFTPLSLQESLPPRRMCDGCAAPCRAECPIGVVGPGVFDWRACVGERTRAGSGCRRHCFSRRACVVAPDQAYDSLEETYHYDRVTGRRLLCERFGVVDET